MSPTFDHLVSPDFRHFLTAARARRRGIFGFVLAVSVIAAGISWLLPPWYASESTLLPPVEGSESFGMMSSLVQSSAFSKIGLLSTQTPSDELAVILRSRTLAEDVINANDLQSEYRAHNMDIALREYVRHVHVDVDKAGVIHVTVEDRKAARAADIANELVAGLDRFNRETYNTRGKRVRVFLAERLADVNLRMTEAESTLTDYERRNKVVASSEAGTVSGIANIMAERLNLQVQRSYVASYSHEDSPVLKQIDAEMAAYEQELAKMPALKQEGSRLALDAELQRRLFALITAQYEDARVQETRDTPTITVLDRARPALMRSRPKRTVLVLASAAAATILALAWVWLEHRRTLAA